MMDHNFLLQRLKLLLSQTPVHSCEGRVFLIDQSSHGFSVPLYLKYPIIQYYPNIALLSYQALVLWDQLPVRVSVSTLKICLKTFLFDKTSTLQAAISTVVKYNLWHYLWWCCYGPRLLGWLQSRLLQGLPTGRPYLRNRSVCCSVGRLLSVWTNTHWIKGNYIVRVPIYISAISKIQTLIFWCREKRKLDWCDFCFTTQVQASC